MRFGFADFETTTEENYRKDGYTRVWCWGLIINNKEYKGNNIKTFFERLPKSRTRIFFHNLKFDGSFIIHYLLSNGYEYGKDFTVLEKMGNYYNIKIGNIEFVDSLNLLRFKLKEIAKAFGTKTQKGTIDYDKYREVGYEPLEEEYEYCLGDIRIIAEAIPRFYEEVEAQLTELITDEATLKRLLKKVKRSLTISGIAYATFKATVKDYDSLFPKPTYDIDRFIRNSYKGGYVYCEQYTGPTTSYDINSSYPNSYRNKKLPMGHGIFYEGDKRHEYDLNVVTVRIKYDIIEGYPPIITCNGFGRYSTTKYEYSSGGEYEEHTFTCVDLANIEKHYNCDYVVIEGYGFKSVEGVFNYYTDFFYNIKNTSTGIRKLIAKLFLNSPYGKTAMSGVNEIVNYLLQDNKVLVKVAGKKIDDEGFQYIPLATFITAYSRENLYNGMITAGMEYVYYGDTDSIKISPEVAYKMKELEDEDKLGYWKNEGTSTMSKFLAPKRYITFNTNGNNKITVKCAGFDEKTLLLNFNNKEVVTSEEATKIFKKFSFGFETDLLRFVKVEGGRCPIVEKRRFI